MSPREPDPAAFPPSEIRAHASRILTSPHFATAEKQRRFLEFTIEKVLAGQAGDVKEYTIALEVYGRKPDYDPKVDSIVRVEASRVRSRLKDYYETDGKLDSLIIDLPKGSYVPVFRRPQAEAVPPPTEPAPSPLPAPRIRWVWALVPLSLLVVLALILWAPRTAPPPTVQSINISAFSNLSHHSQGESLASGLAKELESELTQSGRLRVVKRNPNTSQTADFLLEGTISDDRGKLRVLVQLLNSADGGYVWSQAFHDNASADVVQDSLPKAIARQIETRVRQAASERNAAGTPRAQALSFYRAAHGSPPLDIDGMMLRGVATIERLDLAQLNRVIASLEQAVEADPTFAPAFSALSSAYRIAAEYDPRLLDKARQRAHRAIELEPKLGEAHANLAYISFLFDWKLPAAAAAFQTSLEFEPRILSSYRMAADVFTILGKPAQAMEILDRARAVYPNHPVLETVRAVVLFNSSRFADAEALARQNLTRFPDYQLSHWILGLALEQLHRYPEAKTEFDKCLAMSPSDSRCTAAIGHLHAVMGHRKEAESIIAKYQARPQSQARAFYVQAIIHNGLGDTERAYADLDAALATREFDFPYAPVEPRFANLRPQPRFQKLLAKAGLQF